MNRQIKLYFYRIKNFILKFSVEKSQLAALQIKKFTTVEAHSFHYQIRYQYAKEFIQ